MKKNEIRTPIPFLFKKIERELSYLEKRRGLLPATKWSGESDNQYIIRLRKLKKIDEKDSLTIIQPMLSIQD